MRFVAVLALLTLALVVVTAGDAPGDQRPRKGTILVAKRQIKDGNFEKTVVVLFDVTPSGTRGLIVNRGTPLRPVDVLEKIKGLKKYQQSLFEERNSFSKTYRQLDELREREEERLNEVTWVEVTKDTGTVRIPIDRAIDEYIEKHKSK